MIEEVIKHGKEQLQIFGGEHREFIEMSIKALEQEPKTGHWDSIQGYIMDIAWHCSECGEFTCKKHNYCPNCGADMRTEEGDDIK